MIGTRLAVFAAVVVVGRASLVSFPSDFKFGAGTSAYQVEGAWNESDKSASIWDVFTHRKRSHVVDGSDADVACDSYHNWLRDAQMAEEMGLDYYRFSISWSRLCPSGFCHQVSQSGVRYYSRLIDELLARGVEPVVTIYHWDLPQRLQDYGGWANPLIVDWFASYAKQVFTLYADRVKTFITINEPMMVCDGAYSAFMAPMIEDPFYGAYLCTKNVLLAHAKAWRVYDEQFRMKHHGQVSLSNYLAWYDPLNPEDQQLANLALEHCAGRYSHAIYSKEGGWPPALEQLIAEKSKQEGYSRSRLPAFTEEEKELVKGTFDFYGVNYYTSRVVRSARADEQLGTFPLMGAAELQAALEVNPEWKDTALFWFKQNAQGLRNHLNWLKQQYGDIPFFIMENGFPTEGHLLEDEERAQYFKDHLTQVLLAIKKDGVKVKGYTAWSLMDNFEWMYGFQSKFGLYEVNFTDPQRTRTPRSSAHYYSTVITAHALDLPDEDSNALWIALGIVFIVFLLAFASYKYRNSKSKKEEYNGVPLNEDDSILRNTDRP